MLKKFRKNQKGFTLIELLIVVAIIGILAAIAIPQFAAYRMRGYNAAANSDVRNAGTAEEAMMADFNGYGISAAGVTLAAPGGGTGAGAPVPGPVAGATPTVAGGALTMGPTAGPPVRPVVGVGIGASANVTLQADTLNAVGPLAGYGSTFIILGKHTMGDRAFAREAESTASFQCQNSGAGWVNIAGLAMVNNPGVSANIDFGDGAGNAVGCGGAEIVNWLPM